jgi:DNA-binding NarL/FixJ family response regulator
MLNDKEEVLKNTIRDIEAVKASVKKMAIVNDVAKDVTKKATNEVIDEAIAEDTNKAVVIDVKEEEKSSEKSGSLRKREISNNNQMILDLYAKGKTNIEIAKELGLGIGEVRLVIDLFNSR